MIATFTRCNRGGSVAGPRITPLILILLLIPQTAAWAENWPGWRGLARFAVNDVHPLPTTWNRRQHVLWSVEVPGHGYSSPVVWEDCIYLTSAQEKGFLRTTLCLDRRTGKQLWSRTIKNDDPEVASAMTGHAASTPATDGQRIVACFGNAGVVCYDRDGNQLWQRDLGRFESELGLASSAWIDGDRVFVVCDHDGDRFKSFDSYLAALDLVTGKLLWKTDRRGLYRSWSSPVLISVDGCRELLVNAQDELRSYDPATGTLLAHVRGMAGWVTPTPVFDQCRIYAHSGRDGPIMAIRPGGRGDATQTHVAWQRAGGPYVCSAVVYRKQLYVHKEQGILSCYAASTGELVYRQRLEGKFWASSVAGDGKVYLLNEAGSMHVVRAGPRFELLASNHLGEDALASPALAAGQIFVRTEKHLWCISQTE